MLKPKEHNWNVWAAPNLIPTSQSDYGELLYPSTNSIDKPQLFQRDHYSTYRDYKSVKFNTLYEIAISLNYKYGKQPPLCVIACFSSINWKKLLFRSHCITTSEFHIPYIHFACILVKPPKNYDSEELPNKDLSWAGNHSLANQNKKNTHAHTLPNVSSQSALHTDVWWILLFDKTITSLSGK